MSKQNRFDELARRKLEERQFPFDEAQWQAARQAIRAERNRRRAGGWALAGCVVLLAGLALLWWPAGEGDGRAITVTDIPGPARTEAPAPNSTWADDTDEHASTASASDRTVTAPAGTPAPASAAAPAIGATVSENATAGPEAVASRTSAVPGGAPTPQRRSAHAATTVHTGAGVAVTSTRPASPAAAHADAPALASVSTNADPGTQPSSPSITDGSNAEPTEPLKDPLPAEEAARQPEAIGTPAEAPLAIKEVEEPAGEATDITTPKDTATPTMDEGTDTAARTATEQAPASSVPVDPALPGPLAAATVPADSLPNVDTPNDTSQAALAPALMLPLVPAPSPWELTAWGGVLSSTSRYTGPDSEAWNNASSGARSSAFGLELMHMGRHFGIGTGVHYVTYAEQFDAEAAYRLSESWRRVYFLTPVDTAIFFITDTIDQGGELVYQGISRDTTVLVLDSRMENTITSTKQRDARRQLNRVSYVEVPLLLDAHVVRGRWSFGLIGGPTIGLLSGRHGALPNQANDGYSDLDDRAFRALMFGYTARVYARFRVGDRWSLGLEPSMRGQLASAFSDGVLTRRTQALGGLVSFTYRLP